MFTKRQGVAVAVLTVLAVAAGTVLSTGSGSDGWRDLVRAFLWADVIIVIAFTVHRMRRSRSL
jgi:hypothetical protein